MRHAPASPRLLPFILLAPILSILLTFGGDKAEAVAQPTGLWLPWEGGESWHLTQGPHAEGTALDFQPPDAGGRSCDGFNSRYWVVAAAAGRAVSIANGIEIDHGNGFKTGYLHLQEKQVFSGRVDAGDRLGTVACCPDGYSDDCYATAPHLHFYTMYHGAKQDIRGLSLEGWIVGEDGCLAKPDQAVCQDGWLKSNAPPHSASNVDVELILDSSISMVFEDPGAARLRSMRALLAASLPGDRFGVITFDDRAEQLMMMREAKTNDRVRWAFLHGVTGFESVGLTDIAAGLLTGCNELIRHGKAENRGAILISDGMHTNGAFTKTQQCFRNHQWPVFTIGFGSGGDVLLRQIAADTDGEFTIADSIRSLPCQIQRIKGLIAGGRPAQCAAATLRVKEPAVVTLAIPAGQAHVTVTATWPGGDPRGSSASADVAVTLVSPSGRSIGFDNVRADVAHEAGENYRRFVVSSPEPGDWSIRVSAEQLTTPELEVTISLSTLAQAPSGWGAAPVESPSPAPSDGATSTPEPSPTPGSDPTAEPEETPTLTPTPDPDPTSTPDPTATPTPTPTPTPDPNPT